MQVNHAAVVHAFQVESDEPGGPSGESRHPPAMVAGRASTMLALLDSCMTVRRCVVHAGDIVHHAGSVFTHLYLLNAGFFKLVNITAEGHCQVVGLHFRGDWLGLDSIAAGRYSGDAVALDTGEVWAVHYGNLLHACSQHPALLAALQADMSRAIARSREAAVSLCTLPAAARVAEFLRGWAESLGVQGQCADHIVLRMSRADIGNYLGMTLESVSRAMSGLAEAGVIHFAGRGRRSIVIPDPLRLSAFIGSVRITREAAA